MKKANVTTCMVALFLASGSIAGCDRSTSKAPPAAPTATASQDPHAGHDHSQDQAEPAQEARAAGGTRLTLTGLTMLPDPEWSAVPFEAGSLAPVAVLALPGESPDAKPVEIRITHYPHMKGPEMDQRNIARWVRSVLRPDGTPATTEDAKITEKTVGHVRLTIVDITGKVMPAMREQSAAPGDQRLIAAIVDHPEGPHFVKVLGPAATIAKWEQRILTFLDSAAVAP